MKRLAIVGKGCIGGALAVNVQRKLLSQLRTSIIVRESLSKSKSIDIHFLPYDSDSIIQTESFPTMCPQLAREETSSYVYEPFDIIVVPTKAFQIEGAMRDISQSTNLYHANTHFILFHNGIGTLPIANKYFPNHPILHATSTHGMTKEKETYIKHAGLGETWLGNCDPSTTPSSHFIAILSDVLGSAFPPILYFENPNEMTRKLWVKVAINAIINPLTAIHKVKNGWIAEDPNLNSTAKKVCKEVSDVLLAAFAKEEEDGGRARFEENELRESALKVAKDTSRNWRSMNRDVFYKRETEVDYINGQIVDLGKLYGIPTPLNDQLCESIYNIQFYKPKGS